MFWKLCRNNRSCVFFVRSNFGCCALFNLYKISGGKNEIINKNCFILYSWCACSWYDRSIPSKGYASKSNVSIENTPTVTIEEIRAEAAYLLNKDYVGLSNPNDYNNDGVINAFDMVVLKRMMAETEVSIDEFGVDLFDVHVNETETATFTAAVDSSVELEETAISVYDEDNNFITYLNDNGENGDEFADDGVYSGQADVCSDTRKIVQYYAATEKAKSNTAEISFWTEFTDEDIDSLGNVLNNTENVSFDEALEYLKTSNAVQEILVNYDNETISYVTTAGIPCLWGKFSGNTAGYGHSYADSVDLSMVDNSLYFDTETIKNEAFEMIENENENMIVAYPDKTKVVVLQPFRTEAYNGDSAVYTSACDMFDTIGDLVSIALQKDSTASAEKYDDGDVTVDLLRTLMTDPEIGVVLFNGHGGYFDEDSSQDFYIKNADGTIETKPITINLKDFSNFLMTGEKINFDSSSGNFNIEIFDSETIKDLQAHRIGIAPINDCTEFRYSLNGKFFEKYYGTGESADNIRDTLWYFGSCHSMEIKNEGSIGYSLAKLGVGAAVGFTETVSQYYLSRILGEVVLNGMTLNSYTIRNSMNIAKNTNLHKDDDSIKLNVDSNLMEELIGKYKATVDFCGNPDFRLFSSEQGIYDYSITTVNEDPQYPHFPIYYGNLLIYKKITPLASIKERRIEYRKFLNFHDYTIGSYPDIYYEDENNIYKYCGNHESDKTSGDNVIGNVALPVGDYMFLANSGVPAMQYYYPPNDSELINTIEQKEYHVSYDMADIDDPSDRYYAAIKKDATTKGLLEVTTGVKYEFGGVPGLGSN